METAKINCKVKHRSFRFASFAGAVDEQAKITHQVAESVANVSDGTAIIASDIAAIAEPAKQPRKFL